ncbi:MAG: hypothetical protein K5663_04310 [Clostridiales bacterium]|nr:hypothetical protein [Clostridiales bacterium]
MKKRLALPIKAVLAAAFTLAALWGGKQFAVFLAGRRFSGEISVSSLSYWSRQAYLYFESFTSIPAYMLALTVCLFARDWLGGERQRLRPRLIVLLPAGTILGAGLVALFVSLDAVRREKAALEAGAYLALLLIPLRCALRETLCGSVLQRGLAEKNRYAALAASALVSALLFVLIPGRLSVIGAANGLLLGLFCGLVREKTGGTVPSALLCTGFGIGVSLDGYINGSSMYKVGDECFTGQLSLVYDGLGLSVLLVSALALLFFISTKQKANTRK